MEFTAEWLFSGAPSALVILLVIWIKLSRVTKTVAELPCQSKPSCPSDPPKAPDVAPLPSLPSIKEVIEDGVN